MGSLSRDALGTRFWGKVQRAADHECWPWLAGKTRGGYGRIKVDGRLELAHRIAYQLTTGEIPAGLKVMHECDNPSCCNPAHLRLGTQADNVHDMWAKGRQGDRSHLRQYAGRVALRGLSNPAAKLTDEQVRAIRACDEANVPQRVIGELFGVSPQHVSAIAARKARADA